MAIRFFDMFAGIGGFRSGLEAVGGYKCIGHCEIDPRTNQAYNAMYDTKGEVYYADAREIDPRSMPDFDLLCAGFPCQSFSVAGRRLGFEDDARGTLFFEVARIVEQKQPPFLLLENVPGLLSHDEGRTFNTIISSLVELGYDLEWCVLNSKDFGVPQQRKRLFIVGFHCDGCAGKIFPLTTYDSKTMQQLVPGSQGYRIYSADGIACTQCADAGGLGAKTGLYLFVDMNPDPQLTDYARCITARQDAGISHRKGEHSGVMEIVDDSKNNKQVVAVKDKSGNVYLATIRRLMPIECWRLQGFTDEQFYKAQSTGLKDNYLYKMAGNAVTVNVISEIGKKLKMINIEKGIVRSEE